MTERGEVRIGGKDGEFVSVRRLTRNGPEGWFGAEVEVRCLAREDYEPVSCIES
jgi:hypothetical protein